MARHELTVFVEQVANALFLKEFLAVVGDIQDDVGTAVGFVGIVDGERRCAVARPLHGLRAFLIAAGDDFDASSTP